MASVPIAEVGFEVVPVLDEKAMSKLLDGIGTAIQNKTITESIKMIDGSDFFVSTNKQQVKTLKKMEDVAKKEEQLANKESKTLTTLSMSILQLRGLASSFSGGGLIGRALSVITKDLDVIKSAGDSAKALKDEANNIFLNQQEFIKAIDILGRGGLSQEKSKELLSSVSSSITSAITGGLTTEFGRTIKFDKGLAGMDIYSQIETFFQRGKSISNQYERDRFYRQVFGSGSTQIVQALSQFGLSQGSVGALQQQTIKDSSGNVIFTPQDPTKFTANEKENQRLVEEQQKLNAEQSELNRKEMRELSTALIVQKIDIQAQNRKLDTLNTNLGGISKRGLAITTAINIEKLKEGMMSGMQDALNSLASGNLKGFANALAGAMKNAISIAGGNAPKETVLTTGKISENEQQKLEQQFIDKFLKALGKDEKISGIQEGSLEGLLGIMGIRGVNFKGGKGEFVAKNEADRLKVEELLNRAKTDRMAGNK